MYSTCFFFHLDILQDISLLLLSIGSPFQFTVGQPAEGGPGKVRVSGRGLEYGEVNEMNEFSIYTHEAGAGGLSIAIEGPSKAEISFKV